MPHRWRGLFLSLTICPYRRKIKSQFHQEENITIRVLDASLCPCPNTREESGYFDIIFQNHTFDTSCRLEPRTFKL